MKKQSNAKINMLEHSKAKVELYANYFATYLNILSRSKYITQIHLYDLMCGEGIYEDNSEGSPVIAIKKIKNHFFSNHNVCPNIKIWFNDKDKSEIEKNKYKIERVKEVCSNIFTHSDITIEYSKEDYAKIYSSVIKKLKSISKNERALIFLDPYGYKEIKPKHLKSFLLNGKTELLLFLPISFMSRVADKSLSDDEYPSGEPLKEFLEPLFELSDNNSSTKPYVFISQLKNLFSRYLENENIFVDTFTIERNRQNVYSLFFFTPHILGFEKMLETKWKIDEQQGNGFRIDLDQESLFTEVEMSDYPNELKNFIQSDNTKTNSDLYIFGLRKGFLPKHTNQILKDWQNNNHRFKIYLTDGNKARKNSFYISYKNYGDNPEKVVKFIFE